MKFNLVVTVMAISLIGGGFDSAVGQDYGYGTENSGGFGGHFKNHMESMRVNMFGGPNCGRRITHQAAEELWSGYCSEDCSLSGRDGGCGTGCGSGCGGGGVFGHGGHGVGGVFGGGRGHGGAGNCGCAAGRSGFGWPSAGAGNCGGCGAGCGTANSNGGCSCDSNGGQPTPASGGNTESNSGVTTWNPVNGNNTNWNSQSDSNVNQSIGPTYFQKSGYGSPRDTDGNEQ